ncbi:kinase-like domain-containing protein, partial [Fomitopsis serialis]|uniref:kinase-like domain-containing protein n=1 Tax=Fomitopsis serialis TaxID=139415 RepID=UPI002007983A
VAEGRGDPIDALSTEEYEDCRKGLVHLQQLTNIWPSVKRLDGEVVCVGSKAEVIGVHSEIWKGLWLGEIHVALKVLRGVRASEGAQNRFLHEIEIWSKLKHPHIQPFFGVVAKSVLHLRVVSPWRPEGNLLEYICWRTNGANKGHLLWGAASALAYLHDEDIVHGNVLIIVQGEALLCDFGMAKLEGDVNGTPAKTITGSGTSRWLAPELLIETAPITAACDTWSFGMTMLELFTMHAPWAERTRDAHVVQALANGDIPNRPQNIPELTDDVWGLLLECWDRNPGARPSMSTVTSRRIQKE